MSGNKKNAWRPALSKNLLDMKFMQRSKTKIENEKLELGKKSVSEDPAKESNNKRGVMYIIENSYVPCEDLLFGRLSFRGLNPEIEKLMRENEAARAEKAVDEAEAAGTISAEEMTNRYSTLVGTMGKKFQGKRKREADEQKCKNKR